jgi:hypothetical protein
MSDANRVRWYHRPVVVLIAILAVGPFALPLVWISPSFKRWHKVAITIVITLVTVWLVRSSVDIYRALLEELKAVSEAR